MTTWRILKLHEPLPDDEDYTNEEDYPLWRELVTLESERSYIGGALAQEIGTLYGPGSYLIFEPGAYGAPEETMIVEEPRSYVFAEKEVPL